MARPIWSGSISFGLVFIPVRLFSAVKHKEVRFHEVSRFNGRRIKEKRFSADGQEIEYKDIAKGYPLTPRKMVIISPEELKAADPKASRKINIKDFVDLAEIDPIFFLNNYYVVPEPSAKKAYALLLEAMQKEKKVAIAQLVMRQKKYLAAVRPVGAALMLSTMLYADEIVPTSKVPGLKLSGVKLTAKEKKLAEQIVATQTTKFKPEQYKDDYRRKVLALIKKKAKGQTIEVPKETKVKQTRVADLLAQLEESVVTVKKK